MKTRVCIVLCFLAMVIIALPVTAQQIRFKLSTCTKQAIKLKEGPSQAKLTTRTSTSTYSGPAVICTSAGKLHNTDKFIVTGSTRSAFGSLWYFLKVEGDPQHRWVPAKHLTLGKPIVSEMVVKDLAQLRVVSTRRMTAVSCPHVQCPDARIITKGKEYTVTRSSENGMYLLNDGDRPLGWASDAHFLVKKSEPPPRAAAPPANPEPKPVPRAREKVVQPLSESDVPKFDPCVSKQRITRYNEMKIWRVKKRLTLLQVPHSQCGLAFDLDEGRALVSVGETKEYYVLAAVVNEVVGAGYLHKELFKDQYVSMESVDKKSNVFSEIMAAYLLDREKYWDSLAFKISSAWRKLLVYVDTQTEQALCIFAFLLGFFTLVATSTRRAMLRFDQLFIRTLYFMLRSPRFWRMMRKLVFILALASSCLATLYFYVLWLMEVANQRQMIMGVGSLGLISLSIGMFGVRVAGFFAGVLLFILSLFEFLLFVLLLYFLFLLPSLLLLLGYHAVYYGEHGDDDESLTQFDRVEIERIHARVFRLRNFYPETVINWARKGGLKKRWRAFKEVVFAKSANFDSFFRRVNRSTGEAA